MPAPVADRATDRAADRRALRALRAGRRAERLRHLDWVDALYRAYMVGIVTIAVLMGLAFAVADTRLTVSTIADWRAHGPAIVGIVAAVAAAMGLRSGSHGGPLVFEAADVQHVLLAPVDRGIVVRALGVPPTPRCRGGGCARGRGARPHRRGPDAGGGHA